MENNRKCFKCGCSPAKDNIKLFRFPKPGVTNLIRCFLWAKYAFPEKENTSIDFQMKLHSEHRMLCQRHFKDDDFADNSKTKLLRTAIPCDKDPALRVYPSVDHLQQNPLSEIINLQHTKDNDDQPKKNVLPVAGPSTAPHQSKENVQPVAGPSTAPHQSKKKVLPVAGPLTATHRSKKTVQLVAGPSTAPHQLTKKVLPVASPSTTPHRSKDSVQPVAGPSATSPSQAQPPRDVLLLRKCRKYMQKVCQLRNRIKNLKKKDILTAVSEEVAVQKLSQKITPAFALLLQGQIRNFKKKITGRRWSKEEKITALRIYKRSPTCYRLLRRMFPLPSASTLKSLLRKLPFDIGINKPVFNVLKKFAETQDPANNYYTLMFDEMSLKKHLQYNPKDDIIEGYQDHGTHGRSPTTAAYALVFMITGIRKRFKQPIAHYFSSGFSTADRLAVLIKEVLFQCFEAGINIAALVCDMDGVNRRALSILGSTVQHPYIEIHNKEVVTFYDPPHLLKCFRNLFLKYDIEMNTNISSDGKVGKGVAKWSHIKEFHRVDSNNPNFVYAPALKKEHLEPNTKQKMKVNLAAQVLSHSVAGGMLARISKGDICAEAAVTASMVADMDKLFDLVNADSSDLRRGKPHSTNWSPTSPHTEFFKKMTKFFETMKFVGSPRRPPSQDGWLTTINAFLRLKKNLEAVNITRLATRRLQQDPIENLFGCIRGNCGSNTNPTCGQFVAGLKTAILSNLAQIGTTGNCETDNNTIINNLDTFLSVSQTQLTNISTEIHQTVTENLPELKEDNIDEDNAEIQACAYVCGFIVKRIKNVCQSCHDIFLTQTLQPEHLFTECREYNDMKKSLNYVTKPMIACVENCATLVNHFLKENGHKKCLKETLKRELQTKINFEFLNNCGEHKECNIEHIVTSVFIICANRFCVLKNRSFAQESSAAALKRKMKIIVHE